MVFNVNLGYGDFILSPYSLLMLLAFLFGFRFLSSCMMLVRVIEI